MTIVLTTVHDTRPETFEGSTPEQIVGYLWKTAFLRETSPDEYMVEVARRVAIYNRHDVRTDTAVHFLLDLAAAGLVVINWSQR